MDNNVKNRNKIPNNKYSKVSSHGETNLFYLTEIVLLNSNISFLHYSIKS